jgi:ABC-type uncharacterized transport system permease subunit
MVTALHLVALIFYLAVAGMLAGSLAGGGRRGAPRLAGLAAVGAVAAHSAALGAYLLACREFPLVGFAPSLSVLGFLIGLFFLVTASLGEVRTLGVVLSPLVALVLGIALFGGIEPAGELTTFHGFWLYTHITLAFLGFTGLALAFAAGLVYLLQFRELKGKRLGRIFRFFPALGILDRIGWWALVGGFFALSLGLLVGWAWAIRFEQGWAVREPKVIWGLLTWVIFVSALLARGVGAGCRRRGAVVSVFGFLLVVIVYVVLRVTEATGGVFL